jgi:hypothetical protein
MAAWDPSDLAAMELYHQLVNLSPDSGDRALTVSLRLPNGQHVGDVALTAQDVAALTDAARLKRLADDGLAAWPATEDEITGVGDEVERFLNGGAR